ncbi:hypothetical protein GCM10022630_32060 [Thermobifida alba]
MRTETGQELSRIGVPLVRRYAFSEPEVFPLSSAAGRQGPHSPATPPLSRKHFLIVENKGSFAPEEEHGFLSRTQGVPERLPQRLRQGGKEETSPRAPQEPLNPTEP